MKRYIFFFLGIIISVYAHAQHLKLDYRVPIDGSISTFEFNILNQEFKREPQQDKPGRMAFSGNINGTRSLVYARFDNKRAINDNLVYCVKTYSYFSTKAEAISFLQSYQSVMKTLLREQDSNVKNTDKIDSAGKFSVSNKYGSVDAEIFLTKKQDYAVECVFIDYKNEERVLKTFDYSGIPAKGSDGTYDINPEFLKIHSKR